MKRYVIELRVRAPVLTAETRMGTYGVDVPVARDFDGTPYLPGSHLQGKLREALETLRKVDSSLLSPDDLFGQGEATDPGTIGAGRGRLHIGDLRALTPEDEDATAVRIEIDERTGAVDEGKLLVVESPWKAGRTVEFRGHAVLLGDQFKEVEKTLRAALAWVSQVGGERTIGYGRLCCRKVCEAPAVPSQQIADLSDPEAERFRIVLRFLEPFCVAEPRLAQNVYETRTELSGGVLKGTLARMAELEGKLDLSRFSEIRVTHLVPVPMEAAKGREPLPLVNGEPAFPLDLRLPVHPPRSLVWTGGRLADVALAEGPILANGKAPAFTPDFKGPAWREVVRRFGSFEVPKQLRVRTALDRDLRAAAPEQLYAYRLAMPDLHLWVGELDLSALQPSERKVWLAALFDVTQGLLCGLGKTHATAQLFLLPLETANEAFVGFERKGRKYHVVVLQSPALLLAPEDVGIHGEANSGEDPKDRLHRAYATTFRQLSAGGLELSRLFASQKLEGGAYHLARFMKGGSYREWVLTEPGSTFVFAETDGAKARGTLERWQRNGLGIAERVRAAYALDGSVPDHELWEHCPYLPQNGYGMVAVDLPVHDELG